LTLLLLILSTAMGGYGDPTNGYPNHIEREVHLWTDAVRVEPEAFESDYQAAGCSFYVDFTDDEMTAKSPMNYNFDLNDAARFHSDDMYTNDWFDHASSDGTSFSDRVARYYSGGAIGENIAVGYANAYVVVLQGWMCSSGHRENIMQSMWDELGTGVVGSYYTQDFGSGGVERMPVTMAVHTPIEPTSTATFLASWANSDDLPADSMNVVLNGASWPMIPQYGKDGAAVYIGEVDVSSTVTTATITETGHDCFEYYIQATVGDVVTHFPEEGSYAWGDCVWNDEEAGWINRQLGADAVDPLTGDDLVSAFTLIGCNNLGKFGYGWLTFAIIPLLLQRRKRNA
jgi:hypothetical protein